MEEFLTRLADIFGTIFGSIGRSFERTITNLFGSSNDRYLRKLTPTISAIGDLEPKYKAMSDEELREQTTIFRKRLRAGETLDDLLVEAFAVCREGGRRWLNMRHYDVQLTGGIVLHSGSIAEMITGEGKTLVATLPAYLNALAGSVHVITVNDYLARRDMEWMGPLYMNLGLTVGVIQSNMPAPDRQKAYQCDITYGTNNEFGFDYLRDNMRTAARGDDRFPPELQQVQSHLTFAIIDEVDNILIDEARTPLIISGPAMDDVSRYRRADVIARKLKRNVHFEVNEKDHSAHMTDEGIRVAEHEAGVESFYTAGNMEWPHLIDNALKAHHLYKRDVNYVIQNGEIVIVDEFTGRLMPGRNWSDGLHQAVEAKEGVTVKRENQTLATITLQNFFKLYDRICGMTGTAMTEASEFSKIYALDVIAIPPNRTLQRISHPDVIYLSEEEKYEAVAEEIERINKWDIIRLDDGTEMAGEIVRQDDREIQFKRMGIKKLDVIDAQRVVDVFRRGRPILVGTVSIERSELIGRMLEKRGIEHQVLNAKHHQREAEIVAQAGRKGAVTIATNMAGRGTDIILGGNPEAMAWALLQDKYPTRLEVPQEEWDNLVNEIEQREKMKVEGKEVLDLGGLHIIGTERHESRRIDLQLRGRCGRQGDPGSSRFYLSLEDDLMRIFAGDWVKSILTRLGMKQGEAIESRMVSRRIEGAQKKVEERNFEIRKSLLEYDEVMDEQRKRVYGYRQRILDGTNCKQLIFDMIDEQIARQVDLCLDSDYGPEVFARFARRELMIDSFESRSFRGLTFEEAEQFALDTAQESVIEKVEDLIEENLPYEEDEADWNWEALVKAVNTRWHLSLRERELKRLTREELIERLVLDAQESVRRVDLSVAKPYLSSDFGLLSVLGWIKQKFDLDLSPDEFKDVEPDQMHDMVMQRVVKLYEDKEIEYPVLAGLYHFTLRDAAGNRRYDREGLIDWSRERFGVELDLEDLRRKQRHEIRELIIEHSRQHASQAVAAVAELRDRIDEMFDGQPASSVAFRDAYDSGRMETFIEWMAKNYNYKLSVDELLRANTELFEDKMTGIVEGRYRSEMQKLERRLVLEVVDHAWKDHLLTMDHLRNSVRLRSWAQVDPKVEYKREGMRTFDQMWLSIGDQVTNLIFRIEQLDEGFVSSTWSGATATHEEANSAIDDMAQQQQDAIDGTEQGGKVETIRNREQRVGRNAPCPCGSGKKYKNCCMRKRTHA